MMMVVFDDDGDSDDDDGDEDGDDDDEDEDDDDDDGDDDDDDDEGDDNDCDSGKCMQVWFAALLRQWIALHRWWASLSGSEEGFWNPRLSTASQTLWRQFHR